MWWFKTLEQQLRREMIVLLVFFPFILVNQDGEHGRCFEMHFIGCSIAMLVYYRVLNVFVNVMYKNLYSANLAGVVRKIDYNQVFGQSILDPQQNLVHPTFRMKPAVIETQGLSIWTCSAERIG